MNGEAAVQIVSKHGSYVKPGDIVKLTPTHRARVIWRFQVRPLEIVGEWECEGRIESFTLCPIRFYVVEVKPVD